ncbi:MAG TPA: hypothetical protein VLC09_15095 [Polyangiaceae bacterium]|nr:hypothetical protein [Polyangiaceae bacterium]
MIIRNSVFAVPFVALALACGGSTPPAEAPQSAEATEAAGDAAPADGAAPAGDAAPADAPAAPATP